MLPGPSAFTLTPCLANSSADSRVKCSKQASPKLKGPNEGCGIGNTSKTEVSLWYFYEMRLKMTRKLEMCP